MISGTYILTDTIKSAFATVFTEVYKHTDVVITRQERDLGSKRRRRRTQRSAPSFSESLLAQRARAARRRRSAGRRRRPRPARGAQRQGDLDAAALPGSRFSSTPTATSASTRWSSSAGSWPIGAGRSRDRREHRRSDHYKIGEDDRRGRPRRRSSGSASLGSPSSAACPRSVARRWRSSTSRSPRRCSTSRASSTRSTSRPSRATRPRRCSVEIQPMLPPNAQVRTGQAQAQAGEEGHQRRSSKSSRTSCSRSRASRCSSAAS